MNNPEIERQRDQCPAPVDSGAIGRLNDAERARLRAARRRSPNAHWIEVEVERIVREHTDRAQDRCLRVVNELSDLLDQIAERIDEVGRVDRTDFLDLFVENDLRDLLPSIAENWEIVRAARQEQGR